MNEHIDSFFCQIVLLQCKTFILVLHGGEICSKYELFRNIESAKLDLSKRNTELIKATSSRACTRTKREIEERV